METKLLTEMQENSTFFLWRFFYCFSGECLPQFGSVTSGAHNGGAKFSQKLLAEITEGAIAMAGNGWQPN